MRFPNASLNQQIRRLVYAVTPAESTFEKAQDVPDYLNEVRKILNSSVLVSISYFKIPMPTIQYTLHTVQARSIYQNKMKQI